MYDSIQQLFNIVTWLEVLVLGPAIRICPYQGGIVADRLCCTKRSPWLTADGAPVKLREARAADMVAAVVEQHVKVVVNHAHCAH